MQCDILRGKMLTNIHATILLLYSNTQLCFAQSILYNIIVYFIIFKWNTELLQIFIFELVQYILFSVFSACKYKDIVHSYFQLKLKGKYALLYNKTFYCTVPPIICVF